MTFQHKQLAGGQWFRMNFAEQMANIGSEIERAINWRRKNIEFSQKAFDRALELLDLTILDKRNAGCLKELTRLREMLADHFVFDNDYGSDDSGWRKYFYSFNYFARINVKH